MKFDPFAQWGKAFETWQKLTDESIARTTAFFADLEKESIDNFVALFKLLNKAAS